MNICEGKVAHQKRQGLKGGGWKFVLPQFHCTKLF